MKKQITIATILILMTLRGISQTSNDSVTCIPNSQLKKAINLIERGKVVEEELNMSNQKILLLDQSNKKKDLIISEYSAKDSTYQRAISSYKAMLINLESNLANVKSMNTIDKIRNRKQKLKKWYSLVIGVGIGYLIAK